MWDLNRCTENNQSGWNCSGKPHCLYSALFVYLQQGNQVQASETLSGVRRLRPAGPGRQRPTQVHCLELMQILQRGKKKKKKEARSARGTFDLLVLPSVHCTQSGRHSPVHHTCSLFSVCHHFKRHHHHHHHRVQRNKWKWAGNSPEMVPAASNTGTVTTCGEEQEGHLAVARVILPTVGGDWRGGGGGSGRRGEGAGGIWGAEAGSDIDGDTGAAPGEGYHRANGKRSSNELSWGGGGAEEEDGGKKKGPLSAKCEGEGDQTKFTARTDTNTAAAHPDECCNPPPGRPLGQETLVLINPSKAQSKGGVTRRDRLQVRGFG